ncbi:hypothetical protein DPMN_147864 [Dreissena polymorpha]|uniref:Uncharacterized protein n=1 Tax=Dreissena polymorpha TaxID=45954 RepID=A0A9D4F902_DREPO|nr:hypothetical protein DPMN_147864 [Dreissena polymorpha]
MSHLLMSLILSGFLNEIMSCVLSSLQITDLLSVFYGQPTPLNQVQAPLREFLGRRVLNGAECTPDNVRSSVEDLVESMETEISDTVVSVQQTVKCQICPPPTNQL